MTENTLNASRQPESEAQAPAQDRLALFEEAVRRLRNGETSTAAFSTWLEEVAAQMAERQRHLHEIYASLPPELEGAFVNEAQVGFRGIELYLTGIEHLRAYVSSEVDDLLEQAIEAMRKGNALILDAMRINRENREADDEASPLDEPDEPSAEDDKP